MAHEIRTIQLDAKNEAHGKITQVKLYSRRAEVTRSFKLESLELGQYHCIVTGLPSGVDEDSLR